MVLLYEPDPDLAQMLQLLLEHAGHTVRTVADWKGMELVATDEAALALVDPGEAPDGWTLCREVRALTGASVICLVPPGATPPPESGLHAVAVPISPRRLRELVDCLLTTPAI